MATTVITAATALALVLQDTEYALLSATEYEDIILSNAVRESVWTLQKIASGRWTYPSPLALFGPTDAAPGFTESGGTPYTLRCAGPTHESSVSLRGAAADTRETIGVTGCLVDFRGCVADLLEFVATHRATEYEQMNSGMSVSPQTARKEMLHQAAVLRGVRAL